MLLQKELEKERQQAMEELASRDVRINGLFEELTATQSEVQDMQQQLEQASHFSSSPDPSSYSYPAAVATAGSTILGTAVESTGSRALLSKITRSNITPFDVVMMGGCV